MIAVAVAALAADPPSRPPPPLPVAGECSHAIPITQGQPLPPEILVGGKATCGGVLLPSSDIADLLAVEVWAEELDGRYRVDLAAAAAELEAARRERDWWRAQAERRRPEPAVLLGAGVVAGVGLTVAAGFAVSLVAE